MNQKFDTPDEDADIRDLFAEAAGSLKFPATAKRHLDQLDNPSSQQQKRDVERLRPNAPEVGHKSVKGRSMFLTAAALVVFALAGAGWLLNTSSSSNDPTESTASDPASSVSAPVGEFGKNIEYPNQPLDDPNKSFDGSEGRVQVSATPIPEGYPNASSTGLRGTGIDVSDLEPSGSLKISEDGKVIDGLDIEGSVTIEANDVTIINSRVTTGSTYAVHLKPGFDNLTVQDTRVRAVGSSAASAVFLEGFGTLTRVHITGARNNLRVKEGAAIADSFLSSPYRTSETTGRNVMLRSGSGYTFNGNTMLGPWQSGGSVFYMQAAETDVVDVTIENSYMSGGQYSIDKDPSPNEFSNVTVKNNRFEADSWLEDWKSPSASESSGFTFESNQQAR